MDQESKKVLETTTIEGGGGVRVTAAQGAMLPGAASAPALQALSAEIISLLYEQAFSTGETRNEGEICEALADILLRHWDLCCVMTFLRDADGRLNMTAGRVHPHVGKDEARQVAESFAAEVERTGAECAYWTEDEGGDSDPQQGAVPPGIRETFERTGFQAGLAVPIAAHGSLAGVVTVLTTDAPRLRAALDGVRCVAPAVVVAIGNARRSEAMSEQHRRIESLVEELQQRTNALEEANRELLRVGRYRSLFLARMSHELRTPLTSILGFAEILLDQEDLTAAQRRFCEKIQASGFQLQASLNQLVDLSRLEAGQTELFLHEFSLRETLRESCAAVARLAQKQEVTLDCSDPNAVGNVVSDEGKFRQVLYNFLAFAIGRSRPGGVVRIKTTREEGGRFTLEIADEGEPLTEPAHLFDAVDVDAPNERGTNMNELGLVIAHRLLGVLGGKVALHPLEPRGLAVRLNLPSRPAED